ncbi:MAG TPA: integrin alpha [Planctomycetota bacterium]|nr:integrin alpha [Planctomycetota bacterium]
MVFPARMLVRLGAAAVAVSVATPRLGAQAPTYVGWTVAGTASYNPFSPTAGGDGVLGTSVAVLGDLNGDGVDDVAIQSGNGAFVHLVSGTNGALIQSLPGVAGTEFGRSLVRMPDVNADGVPDFGVGAPGTASSTGRFEVRSGAGGAVLWAANGAVPFSRFGDAAAEIGDVDFDGVADVAVGAPGLNAFTTPPPPGVIVVHSGATGGVVRTHVSPPGLTVGRAVAKAGDVDGDGVPDAVMTATLPPGAQCAAGLALAGIVSGASGAPLWFVTGPLCDHFGWSVAALGDVDFDGVPDFAVGAPDHQVTPITNGAVYRYSGSNGALIGITSGTFVGESFGYSLAGGADWDGDGDGDLFVGAPVVTSTLAPGAVHVIDVLAGTTLAVASDVAPGSTRFGTAVAVSPDLTGDGAADLVVGAPFSSTGGLSLNGAATVRTGFAPSTTGATPFGSACGPPGAPPPLLRLYGGPPSASAGAPQFAVAITRCAPQAPTLLAVGLSANAWGSLSLPLSLGALGMPTCSLLVSPDLVLAGKASAWGVSSFAAPIPQNPAFVGSVVYVQGFVAGLASPTPGAVTSALALTLL